MKIRSIASKPEFEITYKQHAIERLLERGIVMSDVLYVLKNGFVHDGAVPATRPNFYRYLIVSRSPNSGSRELGVVAIPDPLNGCVKIITVMWIDEYERKAGTLVGGENA